MRYAILGSVVIAVIVGLAAVWAVATDKTTAATPPAAALVVVYEQGKIAKVHRLTEAKQVAALGAHFPGYEKRPTSHTAASWKMGYEVYFDNPNGVSVRLKVSSTKNRPTHWSAGRGDFEADGDFHKFVVDLGE